MPLTLTYSQSSGLVSKESGEAVTQGWAGNGAGKNNPAMQDVRSTGPLPQGLYSVGAWQSHPRLGPMAAELMQIEGETFGRSAFFIHGPSLRSEHYGEESRGCIVIPRVGRDLVRSLGPDFIRVIP